MDEKIEYKREVYRKLFHLSSIWVSVALWYMPFDMSVKFFGLLYILLLISELLRIYCPLVKNLYIYLFGNYMRAREKNVSKPSFIGSYYVVLATFMGVLFFSKISVVTAVSIMVISDSAAALIGRKFGKNKLLDKSWEGFIAFLVSGWLTIMVIYYLIHANSLFIISGCVAVVGSAIAELYSSRLKIDDNLTIVVACGIVMDLVFYLLQ